MHHIVYHIENGEKLTAARENALNKQQFQYQNQ